MSRVLEVPLLEADSFLTLDVATDLPEDPSEICQLLAAEACATKWWLAVAAAYAEQGNVAAAIHVAESGLSESKLARTEEQKAPFRAMLGWLHIREMRAAPTASKKEFFDRALEQTNKSLEGYQSTLSGSASVLSIPAVLAQGALMAAVGNTNDSFGPFQAVLAAQPENVFAKMGRARVLYARGNYRAALRLYQDCLRHPAVDPRLGIGLCFWHLQDRLKARAAWERVVSREQSTAPARACAHAMLGAWFLDASLNGARDDFEKNYRAAIDQFQTAYKMGELPLPALKLASYLFSKHDMVGVAKLTDRVLERTSSPHLLAEALFWKARAAHYAGDLVTALALYTQATVADDQNVAAALGKGVVELAQDRTAEALLTFELLVRKFPKNSDALFYAGVFGALSGNAATTRELLQQYLAVCKANNRAPRAEALVLLSEQLERSSPQQAFQYLEEAIVQQKSPALLINLSALAFDLHKFELAEEILTKVEGYESTVAYNLARVREALGHDSVPEYSRLRTVDARARLLMADGSTDDFRALVDSAPGNLELRALYTWHLRHVVASSTGAGATSEQRERARHAAELESEFVKGTLSKIDKHDSYALVAMGNIYLNHAQQQPKTDVTRRQRGYMRAGEFFEKALQIDRHNAYAAQGVAVALAETKRADVAVPLLDRVRESLRSSSVQAFINSGHALMDIGEYGRAAEIYEQALHHLDTNERSERFVINRSDVLGFLARAWLARGSRTKDVASLERAVSHALAASESSATPITLFNLAYVRLQLADVLYRRPKDQRNLEQLEAAQPGLNAAVEQLRASLSESTLPFSAEDLEEKLDHAESVLVPQLAQAITEQREHDQRNIARREEAQRIRAEELARKQEERERKQQEEEQRAAQLAEERARLQEQTRIWEAEREEALKAQQSEEPKKKRKQQADDLIDDTEVPQLPSDESDDEKEPEKAHSQEPSEEEQSTEKVDRRKAVMDDSDDDDNDNENENENKEKQGSDDDLF